MSHGDDCPCITCPCMALCKQKTWLELVTGCPICGEYFTRNRGAYTFRGFYNYLINDVGIFNTTKDSS